LTGEVALEGHRFVREKYLIRKSFDGAHPRPDVTKEHPPNERKGPRLNELAMHLTVREDDDRPAIVQGLENIRISEIKRKRRVILTDTWYPGFGFRDQAYLYGHLADRPKLEQGLYLLENGPLVCRWSRTSIMSPNGKVYSGIYKHFSKKDLAPPQLSHPSQDLLGIKSPCSSLRKLPSKNRQYTFFDMYCGAGGATQGACQAGLKILGGLDHDELAIQAWAKNNPRSIDLNMDSFDFLCHKNWKIIGGCDILNCSSPCRFFSPAQYVYFGSNCETATNTSSTIDGKDDEANINQLHVIKDLIEAMKPRIVVIENTSGLANIEKNQKYFHKLLNDVSSAGSGYNLRYKIINMADDGLPQERKRLIIIAAK
jgi:DNA (cytosine-5)-methyltransferase 1